MTIDVLRCIGSALLFFLVFGMSATVDTDSILAQLKNTKAVGIGLLLQFVMLPFLGFITVKLFDFDHASGLMLLVITSSPGGSYSNWWCSMFNADLALSVTMTAISTCLSVVVLPFNLLLYAKLAYGDDLADVVDWMSLAVAVFLVISAVCAGLISSAAIKSQEFNLMANRLGNVAGVMLMIASAILSISNKDARIWDRGAQFYFGIPLPNILAMVIANLITLQQKLPRAEVVAISIESCYQNIGIATSVSLAMFYGEDLARAIAVPFYYGIVQAASAFVYCMIAWKMGWTKAPANAPFWTMICTSYEILSIEKEESDSQNQADGFVLVDHKMESLGSRSGNSQRVVDLPKLSDVV